jgi:hypothetical protein
MKKIRLLIIGIAIMAMLAACAIPEEAVVTVGDKGYSKSDLEALGTITVDYTDKDGETTAYTGVPLTNLLKDAGLTDPGLSLIIVAVDGYEAEIAMADLAACENCILAFDGDSLRTVMPDMSGKLQVKDVISIKGN